MGASDKALRLNLGCGFKKMVGFVNVDAFDVCEPDVVHDLNVFPYPWADGSVDEIAMWHILEHTDDWWQVFLECTRILKKGGTLDIRVPDETSSTALTFRDHHHVFSIVSFHGTQEAEHGTSAWAKTEQDRVPMKLLTYHRVPYVKYNWMFRFPFRWLGEFCAEHMRNFIWEQRFLFQKG